MRAETPNLFQKAYRGYGWEMAKIPQGRSHIVWERSWRNW
jgi:hypothetical protein